MNSKRIITLILIIAASIAPLRSQVIITEQDQGIHPRMTTENSSFTVMVPMQNIDDDQWKYYTPTGSGALLLIGLGAAYWATRRKKRKS